MIWRAGTGFLIDGPFRLIDATGTISRRFEDSATEDGLDVDLTTPDGFTATVHALDPQVGGRFRMSFTNFATQHQHSFGGEYLELREGELLRYSDRFDDPNLPGELIVTVRLRAVSCGTDLHVTQANIPEVIPPELCVLGWQDSLRQLAALVETAAP